MNGPRRIGRRLLLALWPILLTLALILPLGVGASGELVIKEYISKDVVQVGEVVTFGYGEPPVAGMIVRWNFGDGSPEQTGWPVTHTYTKAGTYTITAVVTYPSTGTTAQATPATIRVVATGNKPPTARAQVEPRQTLAGLPISFDASASSDPDGQIIRYLWNFGDGTSSAKAQDEHAYSRPGTYSVILTVTDNGEMDATSIVSVTVGALPDSIISGINRAILPPAGISRPFAPMVLVDMGVWETERFPYRVYEYPVDLPFTWVATTNQPWLLVEPAEATRTATETMAVMSERISVKSTSLLPRAHTSWGTVTLVINGRIVEMPTAVTVRGPDRDISSDVWSLYEEVLAHLTDRNRRSAMVYTANYPNGADFALGLITEYVLEDGYKGQITRQDFVIKVSELLVNADENGDGVVGFTDIDRGLGIKAK